jgi:hypothetical protein
MLTTTSISVPTRHLPGVRSADEFMSIATLAALARTPEPTDLYDFDCRPCKTRQRELSLDAEPRCPRCARPMKLVLSPEVKQLLAERKRAEKAAAQAAASAHDPCARCFGFGCPACQVQAVRQ